MRNLIAITSLLLFLGIGLAITPSFVRGASIADTVGGSAAIATGENQNSSNNNNNDNATHAIAAATASTGNDVLASERLSITGSTDQPEKPTGPQAIILEILPKKTMGTIGKPLDITILAKHENGTGIPGVKVKAEIGSYLNTKESVRLGGTTDEKGALIVTPIIGEHAPQGQFLVTATASKEGFNKTSVSSGFAVDDGAAASSSGSGSSSGGSSSKCSGSSCK